MLIEGGTLARKRAVSEFISKRHIKKNTGPHSSLPSTKTEQKKHRGGGGEMTANHCMAGTRPDPAAWGFALAGARNAVRIILSSVRVRVRSTESRESQRAEAQ